MGTTFAGNWKELNILNNMSIQMKTLNLLKIMINLLFNF